MTDRRRFWSDATEAEIAEACRLHGLRLVKQDDQRIVLPVADLLATPDGARERQLLRGQVFTIRAITEDGWAYGEARADRYSGWVGQGAVSGHPSRSPTHRVSAAQSYAKTSKGLKAPGPVTPLSLGSELVVLGKDDGWARVAWAHDDPGADLFVPAVHLCPIDTQEKDPVTIAERLIGTPYLWGGNSAFGLDCSALVQIACHACGIACPGDSDQQAAVLGRTLAEDAPLARGDLLFWEGHVAWVSDPGTLLHANARHMAVTHEPIATALPRIEAQGDGRPTRRARLTR